MPIYQFSCRDCGDEFEFLLIRSDEKPSCPNCASENLEKQVTLFSVGKASSKKNQTKTETKRAAKKPCDNKPKEHVGCSGSYVKSLFKKYG